MAEKKDRSTSDIVSDWWNAAPQAPVPYTINGVPVVNQPADRRTFNRNAPAPYLSFSEGISNVAKNTRPLDFTRDMLKGMYGAGKAVVTDPVGTYKGAVKLGDMLAGIYDARTKEQTGKWPEKKGMSPSQLAKWRQEAEANYGKLASHYSYVDKDGVRRPDSAALMRNLTQHPMETMSILTPFPEFAGAKMAASAFAPISAAGKVIEGVSKAGNIATNIAPYAIAKSVKAVAPAVSAGLRAAGVKPTVFTKSGDYSPKMQRAFKEAGVDPALFSSPEMRKVVQGVINEKGISPAAIREAALKSQGIDATRSMTTGERAMAGNVDAEGNIRSRSGQNLAQNMQDNIEGAYQQAKSHRGVFTNTSDFSTGVKSSIEDELSAMGLSLADVQGNVRFSQSQKALRGEKGFPGVFDQFDNLAGAKPLTAADASGARHSFDYGKSQWVDAAGTPVTAPAKIQYLNAVSNRANIPPSPNRLSPEGIDSVRRNVNNYFPNAQGDDAAVLAAINRGIDNYTIQNAPNFTGDGAAMAKDWANARNASRLGAQYPRLPDASPNAPPRPPAPYDPDAIARTEAARNIVQTPAATPNSAVPTMAENIKRYIPSVGVGNLAGYSIGAATGLPGMGLVGGAVGGAATGAVRSGLDRMAATRAAQAEFAGAPRTPLFQAPDVRNPATVAGGIATAAQTNYQTPVAAAPAPKTVPQTPALPEVVSPEEYEASLRQQPQANGPALPEVVSPEEYEASLRPKPQAYGGRTAYKAGGKVNGIEPLVAALMNKAKMAKKTSNKATEPLLNERDDAIANALAVAQKAI